MHAHPHAVQVPLNLATPEGQQVEVKIEVLKVRRM